MVHKSRYIRVELELTERHTYVHNNNNNNNNNTEKISTFTASVGLVPARPNNILTLHEQNTSQGE